MMNKPHLVGPVQPPLVSDRRLPLDLDDGPQLRQLVLDQQDPLQEVLVLDDDDVGLGVKRLLGDLLGAQDADLAHGDAARKETWEYWFIAIT